jgi:hypothetical protein
MDAPPVDKQFVSNLSDERAQEARGRVLVALG